MRNLLVKNFFICEKFCNLLFLFLTSKTPSPLQTVDRLHPKFRSEVFGNRKYHVLRVIFLHKFPQNILHFRRIPSMIGELLQPQLGNHVPKIGCGSRLSGVPIPLQINSSRQPNEHFQYRTRFLK